MSAMLESRGAMLQYPNADKEVALVAEQCVLGEIRGINGTSLRPSMCHFVDTSQPEKLNSNYKRKHIVLIEII